MTPQIGEAPAAFFDETVAPGSGRERRSAPVAASR